jgi:peptide/nickel transport system permease protein
MKIVHAILLAFKRFFQSRILRKLLTTPTSAFGIFLLLSFAVIAILAPVICPPRYVGHPYMIPRDSFAYEPQPPSAEHPLGTTTGQYDLFYGIVWGTRTAFRVGFVVTFFAGLIGLVIGTIAAFYGRIVEEIVMRIVDIFMTMPFLVAAMVLVSILGAGLDKVMIALVAFGWMGYARVIRGEIKGIKELEYILAARALGAGDLRLVMRHILPNAIYPVFVMATMQIGAMVLTAAALSFLGLGAEPGYADWGQLVSYARNWMIGSAGNSSAYWYTVIFPGVTIVLFGLAWNLVGDGFRDIMDPRMQGSR